MTYRVNVVIEKDGDGYYAYCPDLEGCQTQADTLDEAMANISEAVELYVETLSARERKRLLGKQVFTTSVEVKVAQASAAIADEAHRMLLQAGFLLLRTKGSHRIYRRQDVRVVVPYHSGRMLHPKVVKQVLKAIGG